MRVAPSLIAMFALGSAVAFAEIAPETEIYQAVLASVPSNGIYVVREMPVRPSPPAATEFEAQRSDRSFDPKIFDGLPVRILREAENRALFANGCQAGWKAFHSRFPRAKYQIGLSHIVFRSPREAVVYLETGRGCLAAGGEMITLENVAGQWRIKKSDPLWVS